MTISRKAVVVRKLSREWAAGYADSSLIGSANHLEILDPAGRVMAFEWEAVKWVCCVRELPSSSAAQPERLAHKRFAVRPRNAGLWLRLTLSDGDELEGLASNDRSLIDGPGLWLTPPDIRSNTQRIFVPRGSIQHMEVAGLIHAARPRRPAPPHAKQPELFPPGGDDDVEF